MTVTMPTPGRDTVWGDGFVPFHFSVEIDNRVATRDKFRKLLTTFENLEDSLRSNGAGDGFPESFQNRLAAMPSVTGVASEGPFSSIVNPLCMVRSLSNRRTCLAYTAGQGPIAAAIAESLGQRGIELFPQVVPGGDSPVELSIRDQCGHHKTLRLYGVPRKRFRRVFQLSAAEADRTIAFVLSRHNRGRADTFAQIFDQGGLTSLRIAEPTRYVRLEDYLSLLPKAGQVLISYRDKVLRQVARQWHLDVPRGTHWPSGFDRTLEAVAKQLAASGGGRRLVILVFQRQVALCYPGLPSVSYQIPDRFDARSRAGRIQGACVALALDLPDFRPESAEQLQMFGERAVQGAYAGTLVRPSSYPAPSFAPAGFWRSAARSTRAGDQPVAEPTSGLD